MTYRPILNPYIMLPKQQGETKAWTTGSSKQNQSKCLLYTRLHPYQTFDFEIWISGEGSWYIAQ